MQKNTSSSQHLKCWRCAKKHTFLLLILFILTSCTVGTLSTTGVAYQSIRTVFRQPQDIPSDAKIAVAYSINSHGEITPVVYNLTSEIMIIDQTMSFFVNSDGTSTSYYDPTVRTTSNTTLSSGTSGASINLGAVGSALGIGGAVGNLLSGINVGGSKTAGSSITNTTSFADQPKISLSPKSKGAMSKSFQIDGVGRSALKQFSDIATKFEANSSPIRFSVCISYSVDGGNVFEKIITEFFVNSIIEVPIAPKGKINDALTKVYATKPDALSENWWLLYFKSNHGINSWKDGTPLDGTLKDYQ